MSLKGIIPVGYFLLRVIINGEFESKRYKKILSYAVKGWCTTDHVGNEHIRRHFLINKKMNESKDTWWRACE